MAKSDRNNEVYNDVLEADQAIVGTFTNKSNGEINPVTEKYDGRVDKTSNCVVVFVKASKKEALPKSYQVKEGDRVLICAALGQVPKHGDYFTLNSKNWSIFAVIESSAGDDSLFRCYVRKP